MAVDAIGPAGPIGLTVPPPVEEAPPVEDSGYDEVPPPAEAPLPSYQGTAVDETV